MLPLGVPVSTQPLCQKEIHHTKLHVQRNASIAKKVLAIKASASACKLPLVGLMLSTTLIKWNLQGPPYTNTIGIQGNKWNNQREEKSSWKLASASRNAESLVVYLQPYCVHPDSISTIHLAFGHHWNRGHQRRFDVVFFPSQVPMLHDLVSKTN